VVLFNICRKCSHGKMDKPKFCKDGELKVSPSVECDLEPTGMLFMRDDPPEGCPFNLEHRLATQDIDPDFAAGMSGRRKPDESVI
jgi:hypothetical protein